MPKEYIYENYRIGKGDELSGSDYLLYRFYEILPGFLSWLTIILAVVCSYLIPIYTAIFIIAFDVFWLLKTAYLSLHLKANWKRIKEHMSANWTEKLIHFKYDHIYHMIMLPFYKEDERLIDKTLKSLLDCEYNSKRLIIVLAAEERAGEEPLEIAGRMKKKYGKLFGHFIVTVHRDGIEGEMAGKGSNISYAAEEARKLVLDKKKLSYDDVLVSAFDIDTVVYSQYFACLTWMFLANEKQAKY